MKKVILAMALLLSTTVCYFSCSKKDDQASTTAATTGTTTTQVHKATGRNTNPATQEYYGKPTYDCKQPVQSCLPTVVIHGNQLDDLVTAISSGKTTGFFQSQEGSTTAQELGCDANDLTGLQNGSYNVLYVNSGITKGRVILFFGPTSTLNVNQPSTADYIIPTQQ